MKKFDIEHLPVLQDGQIIGAISEGGLFSKLIDQPELKEASVQSVMHKEFPVVAMDTPIEKLAAYINKENGAVLTQDDTGALSYRDQIRYHPGAGQLISAHALYRSDRPQGGYPLRRRSALYRWCLRKPNYCTTWGPMWPASRNSASTRKNGSAPKPAWVAPNR